MFKLFDSYRKQNTDPRNDSYCDVEHLLRFWRKNKGEYLRPLFGDQLILEKEVEYERDREQLREDMHQMLRSHNSFIREFVSRMYEKCVRNDDPQKFSNVMDNIHGSLSNCTCMIDNNLDLGYAEVYDANGEYCGYNPVKSYIFVFRDGSKVQLQMGMKVTRAMTQLCKHLGMESEWEQFRIAHSQVLNQKKLKGTLCLSIHPLDYATASDNDNGWSSCMSWREEGCYRMGTVEMMNSPMVICAYLKSNKQYMSIDDTNDWNSKKWRAWIIVTKDVIICNRHYPYHQEHFATKAIEWVRDLVGEKYGWEYEDIHTDFIQYERDTDRPVEFHTNYMYNDIGGDDVIGCFRKDAKMRNLPGYINFSGPAECMVCGEEIPYDVQGADTLMCHDCEGRTYCTRCECDLDEDQCYTGPDGEIYCEECYNELFGECEECGSIQDRSEMVEVNMPIFKEAFDKWCEEYGCTPERCDRDSSAYACWRDIRWNVNGSMSDIWLCRDCARRLNIVPINFNRYIMNVPNGREHSMKSAYDILRPNRWYWCQNVKTSSYADDEDRATALPYERFYTINWEYFIKKYFSSAEETDE